MPFSLLVPPDWPLVWWGDLVRMPCPMPGCGCFTLYKDPDGGLLCSSCKETSPKAIQAAFHNHVSRAQKLEAEAATFSAESDQYRRKKA